MSDNAADVDVLAVEWAAENYWEMEERAIAAAAFRAGWVARATTAHVHDSPVACSCGWTLGGNGGPTTPPATTWA